MIVSILVTDDKVAAARESAKVIEKFAGHTSLALPLSATGEAPPSHWFCTFDASENVLDEIRALQKYTEVVELEPVGFLRSRGLKTIPLRKYVKWLRNNRQDEKKDKDETDNKE